MIFCEKKGIKQLKLSDFPDWSYSWWGAKEKESKIKILEKCKDMKIEEWVKGTEDIFKDHYYNDRDGLPGIIHDTESNLLFSVLSCFSNITIEEFIDEYNKRISERFPNNPYLGGWIFVELLRKDYSEAVKFLRGSMEKNISDTFARIIEPFSINVSSNYEKLCYNKFYQALVEGTMNSGHFDYNRLVYHMAEIYFKQLRNAENFDEFDREAYRRIRDTFPTLAADILTVSENSKCSELDFYENNRTLLNKVMRNLNRFSGSESIIEKMLNEDEEKAMFLIKESILDRYKRLNGRAKENLGREFQSLGSLLRRKNSDIFMYAAEFPEKIQAALLEVII